MSARETPLGKAFFEGASVRVARALLGVRIVHDSPEGRTVGRIVETEAYLSAGDPASHSHAGRTLRNASMFLAPGHAYVYLIYGVHRCFNVVTAEAGVGEAVLVRALEPLVGLELMAVRRSRARERELCSGPGKLVQAMGISAKHDGCDLSTGRIHMLPPEADWSPTPIDVTPRIGVSKASDLELRFHLADCPWVSRGALGAGRKQPSSSS